MGFLIFAYRKLVLKNKINDLGYQALLISQRKQTVTSQITSLEEGFQQAKQTINMLASSEMGQMQKSLYDKYGKRDDKTGQFIFNEKMDSTSMNMEMNTQMQVLQQKYAYANSIFEGNEKGMLDRLHIEDKQLESQQATIDTQMKQLTPELAEVEKGETEAAKAEAPKFGLG